MYICICNEVSEDEIKRAISKGIRNMQELCKELGIAKGCGRCAKCAESILTNALETKP